MSKSKGNIVVPWDVHRQLRRRRVPLVLLHVQAAVGRLPLLDGDDRRGRAPVPQAAVEHATRFLRPLRARRRRGGEPTDLDRWVALALGGDGRAVTERLDAYDATFAGRAIADFVDDLSQLVRAPLAPALLGRRPGARSRRCATCLLTVAQAARAVLPVHRRRDLRQPRRRRGERAPVRLARSAGAARRCELETAMARRARDGAARAGGARGKAKIKVRQPLHEAVVVAPGREREAIERLSDVVRDGAERQGAAVRRRGRRAGLLRGQAQLPHARPALRQGDAAGGRGGRGARPGARRGGAARRRAPSASTSTARDHELGVRRPAPAMQPLEGYQLEREGVARGRARAGDRRRAAPRGPGARGRARGAGRAQGRRTRRVEDRIALALGGDEELLGAARAHEDYVAGEVLATTSTTASTIGHDARIEGRPLHISVTRV